MKILVFSDSHRTMSGMKQAIQADAPHMVLHLGDHYQDAEKLGQYYPQLPLIYVPGNCDGWTREPTERRLTMNGRTILMSHGHIWQVKSGYDAAIWQARKAGADILLFGHTHRAYCENLDGLWVMNPGTARSTYGTIIMEGPKLECFLNEMA